MTNIHIYNRGNKYLIILRYYFIMKQVVVIIILLFICGTYLFPQEFIKCGSSRNLDEIRKNDPELYEKIMELEKFTQNYINSLGRKSQEQIITIPVVVHVVWEEETQLRKLRSTKYRLKLMFLMRTSED